MTSRIRRLATPLALLLVAAALVTGTAPAQARGPRSAVLVAPGTGTTGATGKAVATFRPAERGRPVELQERTGKRWRTVAQVRQSSSGVARLPVPLDLDHAVTYRAVAVPWRGSSEVRTNPVVVGVRATGARVVAPVAGAVLAGTVDVRVDPSGIAGVHAVAVFVDGARVAGAKRQNDGTWLAQVATTAIPNGRTDVSARARGAHGSRLLPAVQVRIANDYSSTNSGLPDGFVLDTIAGGLELPTSFAVIDEHRTLVTEKNGRVRLVVDGTLREEPVLDLTDRVGSDWDLGLIGLALDPDFDQNGWFYLAYTLRRDAADELADPGGTNTAQRVARYTLIDDEADPANEHVVLGGVRGPQCYREIETPDCMPLDGNSHTIDDLLFLPDGSLLVSVGDGVLNMFHRADSLRAQDLDVLAGKVLRIDPSTGEGVPGNPFFDNGDPGSNRSRVWAYGFRNPFRMTLDPEGELYLADVGEVTHEELDHVVAGGNYGWPCLEGENAYPIDGIEEECAAIVEGDVPTVAPVFIYNHYYVGSATGGVFYTGDHYPDEYDGRYFFADYSYNVIWNIDLDVDDPAATFGEFAGRPAPGGPVKFAIGPDGNVWYVSVTTGELRRIVYDPDGAVCPADRFRGEYFDSPDPAPGATPVLVTCETSLPRGDGFTPPPYVAGDGGFSVRWTGQPSMPAGSYVADLASSGDLELRVDGTSVPDGGTFQVGAGTNADASPEVVATLASTQDSDPGFRIAYDRTGVAPVVSIRKLLAGQIVVPGRERSWTVRARVNGTPVPPEDVVTTVSLLHFGSSLPHVHPSATITGTAGTFSFDEDHAPGRTVFRVDARAVGPDGAVGVADPVYVCLVGNEIGPCKR